MNNLNLQQRDYFILAFILFATVVLYMELQKTKCNCKEKFGSTFYRSLTTLPSIDEHYLRKPLHVDDRIINDKMMARRSRMFSRQPCNCEACANKQ
jgi:hypothetical protein